mmetsp:Transcript_700/g.534  ORF Transcript_700/g.534 Transcript_700/m.534 type:complete len:294 (+) Transcript_700:906-1787(+)
MLKSMTAYARVEKTDKTTTVLTEIRSYNNRYFDIALRVQPEYNILEDKIKKLVSKKIDRGRIELKLKINNEVEDSFVFEVDRPKILAYYNAFLQLKEIFDFKSNIPMDFKINTSEFIKPAETKQNIDKVWQTVYECLCEALDELNRMREAEGALIAEDFNSRLEFISKGIKKIEKESNGLISIYQKKLADRIKILTKGIIEIDSARIVQESAIFADRSDISEEIVRALIHVKQFKEIMNSNRTPGKKLNFLLQEFNREVNTIGSKTSSSSVSILVVDLKAELEKLREQVQNIE